MAGNSPYENLPIPTYEEATSSRPASSQALGPEEISDDAERQGLLRYARRTDATSQNNYQVPTVESARSSLDLGESVDGSERASHESLRRELQEMEIEEPTQNNGSHRSLLSRNISKRISSFTSSFSSFSLPSFRQYIPTWKFPRLRDYFPYENPNHVAILGRLFGAFLIVSIVYVLVASDVFSLAPRTDIGTTYDPESIRIFVQRHMNEHGSIQQYLEYITRYPHMAGTSGNLALGEWVQELFKQAALEEVGLERFDVYLNYPKEGQRKVAIVAPEEMRWEAAIEEDIEGEAGKIATFVFHGHSKAGNVTGPLVYANYGSLEDFELLKQKGISVKGAIALVRYYGTQGDRALKVKAAELAGAVGCIIYSDPAEDGFVKGKVWPDGRYMPSDGVQRGAVSLMSWVVGDVLSPGWASTPDNRQRLSPEQTNGLNKIPSIPLAWRDAQHLLQSLKGHGQEVEEDWKGGVPDVEWWTGDSNSPQVNLMNIQDEEIYQPIYNVLGKLGGWEQPEKKIIVGNHRDAWCLGAADPGSGTAIMLEVVRIFGELRKVGWRPRRTIEFASWDGEEYNLIGSTEHVENRIDELRRNGYAYLNVDIGVTGSEFRAAASPVFERVLLHVLDRTSDPINNRTMRELWDEQKTGLKGLGAGSDYVAFQDFAGTSSLDMFFKGPRFPYHSCYDNYDWMTRYGDPTGHDFGYHTLLASIWALMVLELADRPILPFDMGAYASSVERYVDELVQYAKDKGAPWGTDKPLWDTRPLKNAAGEFIEAARLFHQWDRAWSETVFGSSGGYETNTLAIRRMSHNNRMANFETHLLDLEEGGGLPGRDQFKHVIFAPQAWSGYDEAYFPGVRDAIDEGQWRKAQNQLEKAARILSAAAKKLNN